MEQKKVRLTQWVLDSYKKELQYLKTTRSREVAAMIAEARSFGDLSENAEYSAAKDEQAKLYGRIAELDNLIENAELVNDESADTGRVNVGCTLVAREKIHNKELDANGAVVREWIEYGDAVTYKITTPREADPAACCVSDESPFGSAAKGKAIGEVFLVNAPAGSYEMEVVDVRWGDK